MDYAHQNLAWGLVSNSFLGPTPGLSKSGYTGESVCAKAFQVTIRYAEIYNHMPIVNVFCKISGQELAKQILGEYKRYL